MRSVATTFGATHREFQKNLNSECVVQFYLLPPLWHTCGGFAIFFNLAIYSPSPGSSSNTTLFEYKTWDNNIDFRTIIAKPDPPRGPTPIISHREMMFFTRTRGKLFSISPVPYPRDRTKSPSLKNWTCLGSFPRDGKR